MAVSWSARGTWLTAALWLVSAGSHVTFAVGLHGGAAAAIQAATLLHLGLTLGAQQLVLQARAAGTAVGTRG